jgi:hypothetical protein
LWNTAPDYQNLLTVACPERFQTSSELGALKLDVQHAYFTAFPEEAKNYSFTQFFLAAVGRHQHPTNHPQEIKLDDVTFLKQLDEKLREGQMPDEDLKTLDSIATKLEVTGQSTFTIEKMLSSTMDMDD